jgi:MFS transporter, FHS family, glucose/mannose:H+ symporter
MATTLLGPILPALTLRWRMSDVVAGSLFTAQFLSSMAATLVAPAMAARVGARWALALGFTLLAVGIATIGLAPHAVGVAATIIYGLGLGLVLPLTNIAVAAAQPDRAASALNLVNVSWGVGAVIWPLVVRAIGTPESVAGPTAALAIACAAQAAACAIVVPRSLLTVPRPLAGAPRVGTLARSGLLGYALLYGTVIFLYVGIENSVAGWVAEFAHRMVAEPTTTWALAPTAFWAALTTGRLLATMALRRMDEVALIRGSLALATFGVLAITFAASTPKGVILGAAAAGLGLAAIFPLLWAQVTRSVGARAPGAAGPLYAAGGLGGAVMPWVVGAFSSVFGDLRAGLAVPLTALAILLALSSLKRFR